MSTSRDAGPPAEPKVLRIGIVQRGKIIEEREVKKRETVSIGSSPKATFNIASESIPKSFDLFEFDGKSYYLRFDTGIEGRVQGEDDQVADLKALEARGQIVDRGGKKAVRLSEKSRGKVIIGDVTVLFQFKAMTPAPVRPVLPPDVRGSFLQNIDTQFAFIFVVVAVLQISFLTYARSLPYVEPTSIEELAAPYQRMIMPDREPEPPPSQIAEAKDDAKKKAEDDAKKKAEEEARRKAEEEAKKKKADTQAPEGNKEPKGPKAAAKEKVAGRGLLAVLGATREGAEGGAVSDVFSEGGGAGGSLGDAFSGIQGIGLATEGGQTGTRGSGNGESVGVGDLSTAGGAKGAVKTGEKKESDVRGQLQEEAPAVDGSLDPSELRRTLNRFKSGIKACYENALKRDRNLKGKLNIRFEIDEAGRVRNVSFDGSLRSKDVEECIASRARSWRFQKPEGGSVFVDYPVVFTPSG